MNVKGLEITTENIEKIEDIADIKDDSKEVNSGKKYLPNIFPWVLSVLLYLLAVCGVNIFKQSIMSPDEFGYMATAAFLKGFDWTSVASEVPYYSYGYGLFLLAPIFFLVKSPIHIYQVAILVNGALLVGSFWILRALAKELFREWSWKQRDLICFVIMLYPSYIVYSHVVLAETFLTFLFLLNIWLGYLALKRNKWGLYLVWAVESAMLFSVHERSLGILLSIGVIMLLQFVKEKKRRINILVYAVVLVCLLVGHYSFKDYYQEALYSNNSAMQVNDVSSRIESMAQMSFADGLLKTVQSFAGKWLYLMAGTGFVIWWGVLGLFKKFFLTLKSYFAEKFTFHDVRSVWECLLLMEFVATFMICVLSNLTLVRLDNLIYGRYNEWILGIFLLYSVYYLMQDKKWLFKWGMALGLYVGAAFWCQYISNHCDAEYFEQMHSICASIFLKENIPVEWRVLIFAAAGFVLNVLIMFLVKGPNWLEYDYARVWALILAPTMAWCQVSLSLVLGYMSDAQIYTNITAYSVVQVMDELGADAETPVYYVESTAQRPWAEIIQFLMQDKKVTVIQTIDYDELPKGYYIVGNGFVSDFTNQYFEDLFDGNMFSLVIPKNAKILNSQKENQ